MVNSPGRPKVTDELMLHAARRLTERDRAVLRVLAHHRVLTTDQLRQLFFHALNTAQHRLTALYRLRLIDRFQPLSTAGRFHTVGPYHYVLDRLGAWVLAAEAGRDPHETRWRTDKALAVAASQRLAHIVGVNGLFTALAYAARRDPPRGRLIEWWSEARTAAWCGDLVRPDALGVWTEHPDTIEFLLEYDRATQTLDRLTAKLDGYEQLEHHSGRTRWLLFAFPSPRREATARRALAAATVPSPPPPCPPAGRPANASGPPSPAPTATTPGSGSST